MFGMLSPFIFKGYPDDSMWQKQQSLCSRNVWGQKEKPDQTSRAYYLCLNAGPNWTQSAQLIVELRSCLSLFGKGRPCAIVAWPVCFQALEETVCTQTSSTRWCVFVCLFGLCFVFEINPQRTSALDHKDNPESVMVTSNSLTVATWVKESTSLKT